MPEPKHLLEKAAHAYQAGRLQEAAQWVQQLIQLDAGNAQHHYALGEIRRRQGQADAALAAYRRALELAPTHAEAHYSLALLLRDHGQQAEAIGHFEAAIAQQPQHQQAHLQLGNLLLAGWALDQAEAVYRRLLALAPDHAEAHHNLALALVRRSQYAEAVPHLERALELRPGWLTAQHILGLAHEELGHAQAARRAFAPVLAGAHSNIALQIHVETLGAPVASSQADIDSYVAELHQYLDRKLADIAARPDAVRALSATQLYDANAAPPFFLGYYGCDLRPLLSKWAAIFQPRFAQIQAQAAARPKNQQPRIGFVVTPGHEGIFLTDRLGLINRLDGAQFQLYIFCAAAAQARIAARLTNPAVRLQPCTPELEPMAATICQAQCDVLCYWECGSDTLNYFLPFYRLAPVQCLDWGTPYTSGVPTMDYYISSDQLEPDGGAAHYSERLVQLRGLHTYLERPSLPEQLLGRDRFGLTAQQHIYLCAQNPLKLHPDFDAVLGDILRHDPLAQVILVRKRAHHVAMVQQRMAQTLADVQHRIGWIAADSRQEYFSLLALADVCLDTPHYSGMNISYDTFAVGTPIVTWPGNFMRGRYTAALYRKMDIAGCVAPSLAQVGALARSIGAHAENRHELRRQIRQRSSLLFENQASVAEFSRFFAQLTSA